MTTFAEIQQLASKISLTLDSPESVKHQVKQITFTQKQLRLFKKQLSASVRGINQQAAQTNPDTFLSVLSDISGDRRGAGKLRAIKRKEIQEQKLKRRQPHLSTIQTIDALIIEGDRLKLLAEEYLLDPIACEKRIAAEEEQKRLEEEQKRLERERLQQEQAKIELSKQGLVIILSFVSVVAFIATCIATAFVPTLASSIFGICIISGLIAYIIVRKG